MKIFPAFRLKSTGIHKFCESWRKHKIHIVRFEDFWGTLSFDWDFSFRFHIWKLWHDAFTPPKKHVDRKLEHRSLVLEAWVVQSWDTKFYLLYFSFSIRGLQLYVLQRFRYFIFKYTDSLQNFRWNLWLLVSLTKFWIELQVREFRSHQRVISKPY